MTRILIVRAGVRCGSLGARQAAEEQTLVNVTLLRWNTDLRASMRIQGSSNRRAAV